jgi:hypothetical protein
MLYAAIESKQLSSSCIRLGLAAATAPKRLPALLMSAQSLQADAKHMCATATGMQQNPTQTIMQQ